MWWNLIILATRESCLWFILFLLMFSYFFTHGLLFFLFSSFYLSLLFLFLTFLFLIQLNYQIDKTELTFVGRAFKLGKTGFASTSVRANLFNKFPPFCIAQIYANCAPKWFFSCQIEVLKSDQKYWQSTPLVNFFHTIWQLV